MYRNSYYFLLFVCYYNDHGLIVLGFGKTRLCALSTGEIMAQKNQQHGKVGGSLTLSPLHGRIFPNYRKEYVDFSHLENNWLS